LIGGVEIRKTFPLIKKRGMLAVIITGALAGMMLSIFLAFFVEYLENVKKREEEKNSV
jgi:capsular polysaccharide biosynthesis protein